MRIVLIALVNIVSLLLSRYSSKSQLNKDASAQARGNVLSIKMGIDFKNKYTLFEIHFLSKSTYY